MEREVVRYDGCFVCGPKNPIGLKLRFFSDGKVTRTRYKPDENHEGYKGILHGGIIGAVLDEVMIKTPLALGIFCVTAEMDVRFKAPAPVDRELTFEGEILEQKGRVIKTAGRVFDSSGKVYAEATAKYLTVNREMEEKLKLSLES